MLLEIQENLMADLEAVVADVDIIGSGEQHVDFCTGLGTEVAMLRWNRRFLRFMSFAARHNPICFSHCGKVNWF